MAAVKSNIQHTILYMMPDVAAAQYNLAIKGDSKAARFLAEVGALIKQGMGNVVVNNVQPVVDIDISDEELTQRVERIARERGFGKESNGD